MVKKQRTLIYIILLPFFSYWNLNLLLFFLYFEKLFTKNIFLAFWYDGIFFTFEIPFKTHGSIA